MRTLVFSAAKRKAKFRVHSASYHTGSSHAYPPQLQRPFQPKTRPFTSAVFRNVAPARYSAPRVIHSPAAKLCLQQAATAGPLLTRQGAFLGAALCCAAGRGLHATHALPSWLSIKPPSFAATPVFREQQEQQQARSAMEEGAAKAPTRGPVVYRKNYRLTSSPLYRFAVKGALEGVHPPKAEQPAKQATQPEVLGRFARLGLGDGGSSSSSGGVSKHKAAAQQQQPKRMSPMAALKALADLPGRK